MAIAALSITVNTVAGVLEGIRRRTHSQILAAGRSLADEMEKTAKRDAPWTDRTGNARRTLAGVNTFGEGEDSEKYHIGICGQMSYSPKLEKGFGGRYAVLMPTLRNYRETALDRIRDVISRQEGLRLG